MRKRIIFRNIGLSILLTVFLYACVTPGKKHYDTGMQLSSSGKYMEAIAYLEQAIVKEPNNKEYQAALADLKKNINSALAAILTLNTIAHTIGAAGAGAQAAHVLRSCCERGKASRGQQ